MKFFEGGKNERPGKKLKILNLPRKGDRPKAWCVYIYAYVRKGTCRPK